MAPTTFLGKVSAGLSICYNAKSTCWPGRTRPVAIALLASSAIFAIAQLGLSASMAHQLLGTGSEVNCWVMNDIDFTFSLNDFGSGPSVSEHIFKTEVKSLPLTFANLGRVAYDKGYPVETPDGLFGPTLLRVDAPSQWGGKFITVLGLVISPLLLVLPLLWFLRSHSLFTRFPISNRKAMVCASLFFAMFLIDAFNTETLDTFPKGSIRKEDDVCWHSDQGMRDLEEWRTWARGIVVSNAVLGVLGTCCMIGYSVVAVIAACMNRQNDEPQSMALDDLNGHSTNPSANLDTLPNNDNSFPSVRLGSRASATSTTSLSAQDGSASDGRKSEIVEYRKRAEQEAHVNPFSDPRNIVG